MQHVLFVSASMVKTLPSWLAESRPPDSSGLDLVVQALLVFTGSPSKLEGEPRMEMSTETTMPLPMTAPVVWQRFSLGARRYSILRRSQSNPEREEEEPLVPRAGGATGPHGETRRGCVAVLTHAVSVVAYKVNS